jgi:hypothetical protein
MVDSIPVDILNGGSIFIFQNADISILSEMYMVDSISVDILSNSILSEMRIW